MLGIANRAWGYVCGRKMDMLHKAQALAGGQTNLEWFLFGSSAVLFHILYVLFGLINKQGAKSKSCWLSHIHVLFTVPSACLYWLIEPVNYWSTEWMIEGPGGGA